MDFGFQIGFLDFVPLFEDTAHEPGTKVIMSRLCGARVLKSSDVIS